MTENTTPNRIFKIGATTIQADASMAHLDNEGIRAVLKRSYPEVALYMYPKIKYSKFIGAQNERNTKSL